MTPQERETALDLFIDELGLTEDDLAYWQAYEMRNWQPSNERLWIATNN